MKKHNQLLVAAFAIAIASIAHSAPPKEAQAPEEIAKAKVNTEILEKISPQRPSFSRSMPIHTYETEFQPQILVNGETRLPFSIQKTSIFQNETFPVVVKGYVRLGDQEIYLHDEKTETDVPAAKHPLFAPAPKAKTKLAPYIPG
ncbi:MAG: hypothetical protein ACSHX9_05340 [Luteolibacter sp.]